MKRMFAVIFAAVPFAFGLIRAFETGGRDVRYIWVAGAAFAGAAAIVVLAGSQRRETSTALTLSVAVFAAAALFALVTGWQLGTTIGPALFVVGAGFAFCFAAASLLHALRRR